MSDVDSPYALPKRLGQHPFHMKGYLYKRALEWVDDNVSGGVAAMREHLPDDAHRAFFAQTFLASSWYDVFALLALNRASARALGMAELEYIELRAKQQAAEDFHGIYRLLLRIASPERAARYLPVLTTRIFDFGTTETRVLDKRRVEAVRTGTPELLCEWYLLAAPAYVAAALEASGARGVSITAEPPIPSEHVAGVPTASIRFIMTWSG